MNGGKTIDYKKALFRTRYYFCCKGTAVLFVEVDSCQKSNPFKSSYISTLCQLCVVLDQVGKLNDCFENVDDEEGGVPIFEVSKKKR